MTVRPLQLSLITSFAHFFLGVGVIFAPATGHSSVLDTPIGKVLGNHRSKGCGHIMGELNTASQKHYGGSVDTVPTREFLTLEFLNTRWPKGRRPDLRWCLAGVDLPSGLSAAELALYEQTPYSQLFTNIRLMTMPTGFGIRSLAKFYDIYFTIDAVRDIQTGGRLTSSGRAREFMPFLEMHLGQKIADVRIESQDPSAAQSRCGRILTSLSDEDLFTELRDLTAELQRRLNAKAGR